MSLSKGAVCNLIKTRRRYARLNYRHKTIRFLMFFEKNIKINTVTHITVNEKTGHVNAMGCISEGRRSIFPGINGKQNCNDPGFVEKMSARHRKSRIKTD